MADVTLRDVRKIYAGGVEAVKGVDFDVPRRRSSACWSGPSGCGKSTLLRMVAGLETITVGEIRIGERVVNEIEPAERDIAMVFQNYALYPHMSVYDNMAYGLRNRGMPKAEIETRVREAARILEIEPLLDRKPRAALRRPAPARRHGPRHRAPARRCSCSTSRCRTSTPSCASRCGSRSASCSARLGTTSIYVTHDQLEAMTLADMLVVMNGGQVEQIGEPLDDLREAGDDLRRHLHRRAADEPAVDVAPRIDSQLGGGAGRGRHPRHPARGFRHRPTDRRPAASHSTLTVEAIERVGAETFVYGCARQRTSSASQRQARRTAARRDHRARFPDSAAPPSASGSGPWRRAKSCICSAPTGGGRADVRYSAGEIPFLNSVIGSPANWFPRRALEQPVRTCPYCLPRGADGP